MLRKFSTATLVVLAVFWSTAGAHAGTIRVERDGSGDYTTLQPALDAAAVGDTVLIGPGEYTELTSQYLPGNGGWVQVVGYVKDPGLTIVGSGEQATILGPSEYTPGIVINSLAYLLSGDLTVQGLTIRNCSEGMHIDNGRIYIYDCRFEGNQTGIGWYSTDSGGGVWDSSFTSTISNSNGVFFLGSGHGLLISKCNFSGSSLIIQDLTDVQINDCEINGGTFGIQLELGSEVLVNNCFFHDLSVAGIGVLSSSRCIVGNSEISGGVVAVSIDGQGYFEANNSIFRGGSQCIFDLHQIQASNVNYSDLIRGGGDYSIICTQFPSDGAVRHDFRGNYWGTTDPAQIEAWILDGHDDPNIRAEVLYTPFATGATDLVLALTPADSVIVIPDVGGSFQYDAYLENNTQGDIIADIAIEAVLPDGTVYPVQSYPGQTIPAASAYTRTGIVQDVPPGAPAGTYTYRVTASLGDSVIVDSDEFPFEKQGAVGFAAQDMYWNLRGWDRNEPRTPPVTPAGFALHAASPNPFNPTTTLSFDLPRQETVTLRVFDLQGRLVRSLLSGEVLSQGRHEAVWDGRDDTGRQAASGTYFYRLEAGVFSQTRRAVLVK